MSTSCVYQDDRFYFELCVKGLMGGYGESSLWLSSYQDENFSHNLTSGDNEGHCTHSSAMFHCIFASGLDKSYMEGKYRRGGMSLSNFKYKRT